MVPPPRPNERPDQQRLPKGNYREPMRPGQHRDNRIFRREDQLRHPDRIPNEMNRRMDYGYEPRRFPSAPGPPDDRRGPRDFMNDRKDIDQEPGDLNEPGYPPKPKFRNERFPLGGPFTGPPRQMIDSRYQDDWRRNDGPDRWQGPSRDRDPRRFQRDPERPPLHRGEYFRRDEPYRVYPRGPPSRDYRIQGIPPPPRDYFPPGRPRSPPRRPMENFDRREQFQRPYMSDHRPYQSGNQLISAMNNPKRIWNGNNSKEQPYLMPKQPDANIEDTGNDTYIEPVPHPPKATLLPVKKEHYSESDGHYESSSESDDDGYDQDYIEEQIDRIDNEITKQERLLAAVRAKMEESEDAPKKTMAESESEKHVFLRRIINSATGHSLADSPLEDAQKKPMEHNTNPPIAYSQLIADIYEANHKLAKELKAKNQQRNLLLFNLSNPEVSQKPGYDPSIFEKNTVVDPKLRPAIVAFISARIVAKNTEQRRLLDNYKGLEDSWSMRVEKLEEKYLKKNPPPVYTAPKVVKPAITMEPLGRSSRRAGFRSDVVRTEAEWQTALSMLGIMPEPTPKPPQYEMFAKDVPMLSKADLMRDFKYVNNNDLVVNPERDLTEFNSNLDQKWTEYDRSLFRTKLALHGKDFFKIASYFDNKSTSDCVAYYYREKVNLRFKNLLRRSNLSGRGRKRKEKPEVEVNPIGYRTFVLDEFEEVCFDQGHSDSDNNSEKAEEVKVTKKSKAETAESGEPEPLWTEEEKTRAQRGFELFGRDFGSVATLVSTKTAYQCKVFFNSLRRQQAKEEKLAAIANGGEEVRKKNKPGPKPKKKKAEQPEAETTDSKPKAEEGVESGDVDLAATSGQNTSEKTEKKRKPKTDPNEKKKKRVRKLTGNEESAPEGGEEINTENPDSSQTTRRTVSYWSVSERADFLQALSKHGRNWELISKTLESKSPIQVRNYFHNSRKKLKLDKVLEDSGHGSANPMTEVDSPSHGEDKSNLVLIVAPKPNQLNELLNPTTPTDVKAAPGVLTWVSETEVRRNSFESLQLPAILDGSQNQTSLKLNIKLSPKKQVSDSKFGADTDKEPSPMKSEVKTESALPKIRLFLNKTPGTSGITVSTEPSPKPIVSESKPAATEMEIETEPTISTEADASSILEQLIPTDSMQVIPEVEDSKQESKDSMQESGEISIGDERSNIPSPAEDGEHIQIDNEPI